MPQNQEVGDLASLKADNRRLRALLDAQDAPGELRHRLRSTLSLMRSIIRRSAETNRDLPSYVAHLEDRMDAIARAQATADAQGVIDLHGMLSEELLQYDAKEGEKVHLSGPPARLQPRAGQIMALAAHELAVNAIEHGSLGSEGRLEVSWFVTAGSPENMFTMVWKERGDDGVSKPSSEGFGTEVLTRMLSYELAANALLEFEEDGLRCTVRFPMSERVGRIEGI
jgi:two-component sensor histidine kinase